jgi:hypothetical protein
MTAGSGARPKVLLTVRQHFIASLIICQCSHKPIGSTRYVLNNTGPLSHSPSLRLRPPHSRPSAPDAEALWVRLRLLCVAALWKAHCRRHHGDRTPLVTVIAVLVSRVRELMARDAALVIPDGPLLATVGGNSVSTPLPGLTREAFLSRWDHRDALCSWPAATARPLFHLTLVHPAPLPPEGRG